MRRKIFSLVRKPCYTNSWEGTISWLPTVVRRMWSWLVWKSGFAWSWGTVWNVFPAEHGNSAPLWENAVSSELDLITLRKFPSKGIHFFFFSFPILGSFPTYVCASSHLWPKMLLLLLHSDKGKINTKIMQNFPALGKIFISALHPKEFPEEVLVSYFCSTPPKGPSSKRFSFMRVKDLHPKFFQKRFIWGGGIQESGCFSQGEEGQLLTDCREGLYKSSKGVSFFQGIDFQGGN